jgi:hypothetical protein
MHALNTTSSSNYANAQAASQSQQDKESSPTSSSPVKICDGRRNSQGEVLPSPTETWKPSMNRVQSWSREEFKRVVYKGEMVNGDKGQGTGFTEGGEGTREV